jgi:hypothetical protein
MIVSVSIERQDEFSIVDGESTMARLNALLGRVAAAYSDDPGTSDLDDEQPAYSVTGLTLGDVRLARRLTR